MSKQILRKEIGREVQDGIELIKMEYLELDNLITNEEQAEMIEDFDDSEEAYSCGLGYDVNDTLVWIDVDKLIEALDDYFSNHDYEESQQYKIFKTLQEKLEKYKGFTIWL